MAVYNDVTLRDFSCVAACSILMASTNSKMLGRCLLTHTGPGLSCLVSEEPQLELKVDVTAVTGSSHNGKQPERVYNSEQVRL